ncbi:hypothetical protein CTER_1403 [Ruminiclostridium cellobioparum subsp. termitidis CT1112]|uniref:Uncharacterized protein n=1 Tax=Ruminiclostridium cellobioparum subsp. termitidis CT1112 TaxID=1195236 RepID=S0FTR3_RUMCE|nr:hypothetical protein CTER_1403 [Ruminiclostridium cellobioparum subsp. termitidis CT1112]
MNKIINEPWIKQRSMKDTINFLIFFHAYIIRNYLQPFYRGITYFHNAN